MSDQNTPNVRVIMDWYDDNKNFERDRSVTSKFMVSMGVLVAHIRQLEKTAAKGDG